MASPRLTFTVLVAIVSFVAGICADNVTVSMEAHIRVHNRTVMSYKVEPLPDSYCLLGEGPHWDIASQSLFFVDINNGKILRYDYKQNKVYKSQIENETFASFIVPVEGTTDKFAVGIERRVAIVTWDGISETCKVDNNILTVEQEDVKYDGNRFNDGKCDPRGRLFAGTMRYKSEFEFRYGHLYRIEGIGKYDLVKDDVGISNGLAWNEKTNKFYYIDTTDFEVKEYTYDFNTGEAKNPKVIFDLRNLRDGKNLLPDGMTIDSEGFLYVSTFNGSTIFKIDPKDGKILLEIKFPCEQVTSAAFGGPNLDILYVTTAALNGQPQPSGTTYKVTGLGAKGLPMAKLRL